MKYFIFILTLLAIPLTTHAASTMTINLFYSDNKLVFGNPVVSQDKNAFISIIEFQNKIDVSTGDFVLKIIDCYNQELITEHFNAQPGGFSLTIPYFPTITKMQIFEKDSQQPILEQDLNYINTCNANGICELERGESGSDCIIDCGVSHPKYSQATQKLLDANNGVITNAQGELVLKGVPRSSAPIWAIITAIGIVVLIAIIIIIRKRKYGR